VDWAGCWSGDVIYAANGQSVSTLPELREMASKPPAGEILLLQIERRGKIRHLEVVVE
jgi:S1-C subfamily serine protease